MNNKYFEVELTNGTVNDKYKIKAVNEEQAIILAQAEAINNAKGYKLVSVNEI